MQGNSKLDEEAKKKRDSDRKKMLCSFMEDPAYVPMKEKELAILLQTEPEDRPELHRLLQELLSEGEISVSKRGKYQRAQTKPLTGIFTVNAKGFGFVQVEEEEEAYYIARENTGGAFPMDTVQIVRTEDRSYAEGKGKRREARVTAIVSRGITHVVGTYSRIGQKHYGFVIPDRIRLSQDIFVPEERSMGAVDGHKVVVEITDYGSPAPGRTGASGNLRRDGTGRRGEIREGDGTGRRGEVREEEDREEKGFRGNAARSPEGRVVEILGHVNDPGVDILSIVRSYELPVEFPENVLQQAARAAKAVSAADMAGRRDLRDTVMVTIDGEDAKDLDDAVSIRYDGSFYHLGVHIADVTNYVQENSALDREARDRGTSVYLADRVIPMLPHALSNGICSLNEGEDRLALSCLMKIDRKGEIVDYEICESVIRVAKRMSYTVVKELLEDPGAAEREEYSQYGFLLENFHRMQELAEILRQRRRERGGVDFDFPECKISLDPEGRPLEIKPYERNAATRIIEDFMLAANETVAQHFYWMDVPFVYRVHGVPDREKLQSLSELIRNMGYSLKTLGRSGGRAGAEEVHPKEIQKLLDRIQGTPEEAMISRMVLRSMKQAKYSVENSGHFGLACPCYCHFTSPIRRYPDLQIHRIIKDQLRGRLTEERMEHYRELLPGTADLSSRLERRADEAERETEKLKKVQYMERHIGECFDGVISGVTSWGLYVELMNTVEGLVHVSKLTGDYYFYREKTGEMVGETTGKTFQLGMPVRILVEVCDAFNRTIDFFLAEEPKEN